MAKINERFSPDVAPLREELGRRHKELRERKGMSQPQMQRLLGISQKTFISQIEIGFKKIPSERYEQWASILGVETRAFVQVLLRAYDPWSYRILFGTVDPYEGLLERQMLGPRPTGITLHTGPIPD